ncbi:DUF481 domain-containing protein [Erythrobacter litoralis]|uniref:DUF481 domain-containing protein n=1 Tax=Erythrobacter litoralis TaxID=39960 RepID=UPI002435622A|nr:DUF481 domain-containing protein [Erythrobacter litoralis]
MIAAAIETGDDAKVKTVVELARTTYPDDTAEIDALQQKWSEMLALRDAEASRIREAEIREAGFFDLWSGEGELGGFHSAGNTDSVGASASLALKREGLAWSHRLRLRGDYQRQNGTTSREQVLAAYEPRWEFADDWFAYGLAQYERDTIQGFKGRYAISGGLGYTAIDREGLSLSVKAGPAYRVTDYIDQPSESRLAALAGLDFDWQVFERLSLNQSANAVAETGGQALVIVDSSNTTLNLVTGLDFKVTDSLRSRLSYQVDYDSNPPVGAVSADTLTRFTLVYGF